MEQAADVLAWIAEAYYITVVRSGVSTFDAQLEKCYNLEKIAGAQVDIFLQKISYGPKGVLLHHDMKQAKIYAI